jgi:hypothetical protein
MVVRRGGWSRGRIPRVGKETPNVVAGDDLHERARLDVPDFDESRLEREHIGVVQS